MCMVACEDTDLGSGYTFGFADGTQTSVAVQNSAATKSLTFDAPAEWSAQALDMSTSATADWVSISAASGSAGENNTINISFTENESVSTRSAKVSIVCEAQTISVLFQQYAGEGQGVVLTSTSEYTAPSEYDYTNPLTLDFTATSSWVITVKDVYDEDPAWLTIDKYSGVAGEYSLDMMVADNAAYEERTATIYIESNGYTTTATLTQEAMSYYEISMELVGTTAGTITVDIDPGDYTGNYFVTPYSTVTFDEYGYSKEVMMDLLIKAYINAGYDLTAPNGYSVYQGKQTLDLSIGYWLSAETSYNVLIAGITEDCVINSNVEMTTAVTEPITYVTDLTFEYSATDIWMDYATVSTTPSRNGVKYFTGVASSWYIEYDDADAWYANDEEFMQDMVSNAGLYKDYYTYEEAQTATWTGLWGNEEYLIYTFAIDGNLAVSALDYGKFWTFDGMMDYYGYSIDYEIVGSDDSGDVFIDMDPGEYTGIYYLGAYFKSNYSGDAVAMARTFLEYEKVYYGYDEFIYADNVNFFKGPRENFGIQTAWPGMFSGNECVVFLFGVNPDGTIPTDITTFEVTMGNNYNNAPLASYSENASRMDSLVKFAESRKNGETIVNTIAERLKLNSSFSSNVEIPFAPSNMIKLR